MAWTTLRLTNKLNKYVSIVHRCPTPTIIFHVQWTIETLIWHKNWKDHIIRNTCVLRFKLIGLQLHQKLPWPKTLTWSRTDGQMDKRTDPQTIEYIMPLYYYCKWGIKSIDVTIIFMLWKYWESWWSVGPWALYKFVLHEFLTIMYVTVLF